MYVALGDKYVTGNFVGEISWKGRSARSSSGAHRRILETQAERSEGS